MAALDREFYDELVDAQGLGASAAPTRRRRAARCVDRRLGTPADEHRNHWSARRPSRRALRRSEAGSGSAPPTEANARLTGIAGLLVLVPVAIEVITVVLGPAGALSLRTQKSPLNRSAGVSLRGLGLAPPQCSRSKRRRWPTAWV